MKMQGYCNVFLRIILKRASTKAHAYVRRHQGTKFEHVSDLIYHKFSHGTVSYTLNGNNVNVMLEYIITLTMCKVKTLDKSFCKGFPNSASHTS